MKDKGLVVNEGRWYATTKLVLGHRCLGISVEDNLNAAKREVLEGDSTSHDRPISGTGVKVVGDGELPHAKNTVRMGYNDLYRHFSS